MLGDQGVAAGGRVDRLGEQFGAASLSRKPRAPACNAT